MNISTVKVKTSSEYKVITGAGILSDAAEYISEYLSGTIAVITDDIVERLYAETLLKSLYGKAKRVIIHSFPAGEKSKNIETFSEILEFLAANKVTRSDLIIALGGGVVGDITGFAAGTYLRGTPFIGIPTTFLAAIDSSVGGKTGINLSGGKNLAGVFNQPKCVITDTDTFKTLSDDVFSDGVAETLKHGILADANLFETVAENDRESLMKSLNNIVQRNVEIKAAVVAGDEFDRGNRQLLNLGHTIGHAIERCGNYKTPHGRAVATGMAIITRAAARLGYAEKSDADRILAALRFHSFPLDTEYTAEELCDKALLDKKRSGGTINLVFPRKIGECFLSATPVEKLYEVIKLGKEKVPI